MVAELASHLCRRPLLAGIGLTCEILASRVTERGGEGKAMNVANRRSLPRKTANYLVGVEARNWEAKLARASGNQRLDPGDCGKGVG